MPPPYKRDYFYFNWRARTLLSEDRPQWAEHEKRNTINAIWNAEERVREHFNGSSHTNPGPELPIWLSIPMIAYTKDQSDTAKASGTFQGLEPDRDVDEIGGTISPPGASVPGASVQLSGPDDRPYHFWPRLPWEEAPDIQVPSDDQDVEQLRLWFLHGPEPEIHGDRWRGVRKLGKGGYGIAGLWVRVNETHDIVDQMVIKDMQRTAAVDWRDPQRWRDRRPREMRIHELVEERRAIETDGCPNLVTCRGSRLLMLQRRYRLYLEFCTGESLSTKIAFAQFSHLPIPESVVWNVLRSLARACLVLQGSDLTGEGQIEGRRPITHLDLQPGNVFIRLKRTGPNGNTAEGMEERISVEFVLGDFGQCFYSICGAQDFLHDNPEDYLLAQNCGRYAPEHQLQSGPEFVPLGALTDVWGIGNVGANLICNQFLMNGPIREDVFETDPTPPQAPRTLEQKYIPVAEALSEIEDPLEPSSQNLLTGRIFPTNLNYSQELRTILRRCLHPIQNRRIGLRDLFNEIEQFFQNRPELTHMRAGDRERMTLGEVTQFSMGNRLRSRSRSIVADPVVINDDFDDPMITIQILP